MNWFVYRLPGEKKIIAGSSKRLLQGCGHAAGFVVAPFDGDPAETFTIPDDKIVDVNRLPRQPEAATGFRLSARSTTRAEHRNAVTAVIESINSGIIEKCVIARSIVNDYMVDVHDTFTKLCNELPDAFVFAFDTDRTGLWMGASPEILVTKQGGKLHSMALAGTRPAGSVEEWDAKNLREQEVVRQFVETSLGDLMLNVNCGETHTLVAGPVEHISTEITGTEMPDQNVDLCEAAAKLSPTPALSGYPRREAIKLIRHNETFDRAYYGGYCGPIEANGDGRLFVNLRSMQVEDCRYCLYVGGGIMGDSEPDVEWDETERKATTLQKNIEYIP